MAAKSRSERCAIKREELLEACKRCTELREADLRTVSHLDNDALMHVAKHCSKLSRLRIHDMMSMGSKITSVGLIHLTRICSNLIFLDISYTVCSDKALEYIGNLPDLRSLHMQVSVDGRGVTRVEEGRRGGVGREEAVIAHSHFLRCTKLEEINLYRTSVSAATAAQHLSKAMKTRPLRVNMLNPDGYLELFSTHVPDLVVLRPARCCRSLVWDVQQEIVFSPAIIREQSAIVNKR
eukprot:756068-Hanusia_phi.AAC.3